MKNLNTSNPLEALAALTARVDSSREQAKEQNRRDFPELAKYIDELRLTGDVKLIHAINFETGVEIGKKP